LDVLKSPKTPGVILDEVIASLRLPDGSPRPITLAPDAAGTSALRYALEAHPPDRPSIKAILESVSAGFAKGFGFAYREEAPTLHEDVLFLAEEVPSCLDLLVDNLLNSAGALTRLPAERQIERVKHDFKATGPLTQAGKLANEAPFQQFVDDSGVASASKIDQLHGKVVGELEDVLGDVLLHGQLGELGELGDVLGDALQNVADVALHNVAELKPVDTSLAMLSVQHISHTPARSVSRRTQLSRPQEHISHTPGYKRGRCLLAILLDAHFVDAFETPAIRLLVEHQWRTFGKRYARLELVAFVATLLAPFISFAVYLARVPHDMEFGHAATFSTTTCYALCWPWLLRHTYQQIFKLHR
jgi:hypothetical protein